MRKTALTLTFAIAASLVAGREALGQAIYAGGKEQVAKYVAVLKSDAGQKEKMDACRALAIIGDKDAVEALAGLLADEKLSHMARYALEPNPDPAADEALRGAVGKVTGRLLIGVINSIGMRRDAKATSAMIALLKDREADVAAAAANALGRIATAEALETLAQLRAGAPASLQAAAANASLTAAEQLLRAGKAEDAAAIYEELQAGKWAKHIRVGAFAGLLAARPDEAVARAFRALKGDDPILRAVAIAAVGTLKGAGVAERFAAELPSLAPDVQVLLVGALADRGDAAARPAIASAAGSSNAEVRLAALKALGAVGDASCVEALCKALAAGGDEDKRAASASLRGLKGEGVDAALLKQMQAAPPAARADIIEALADRKAPGVVAVLMEQAKAADEALRATALRALGRLAAPADLPAVIQLLLAAEGDSARAEAERAVVLISRKVADEAKQADAALAALKSAAPAAKASLLKVLGGIGGTAAFEAVLAAAADNAAAIKDAAIRTLVEWPDARALDALLAIFRTTDNEIHRVLALRGCARLLALGSRPAAETLKAYAELMQKAARPEDRKLVLAGLGSVADLAALKMVEPLLADAAVRAEAEQAMLNIAQRVMAFAPEEARAVAKRLQADSKDQRIKRAAGQLIRQAGEFEDYLVAWQVSGPYGQEDKGATDLFDIAFPPEKADAKAAWRALPPGKADKPWMMDLSAGVGGESRAAYARTWVFSAKEQPARLEFGTDDGHKVWLNGKLVASANRGGAATPGDFRSEVSLKQGWNALLLKITQDSGPWEFCFRIAATGRGGGGKLAGLKFQPTPPAEQP